MRAARAPLNSGRTMAVGVGVVGVVGVLTLLAILFNGGGTGDGGTGEGAGRGSGTGAGNPATQTMLAQPQQPQRPMRVSIRDNNYVVNGQNHDLATLVDMATKVPPGEGAAVLVERSATSRAKAEEELFAALDKRGVKYSRD